ncbi:MAG: DNA primase [Acidobacteria bacterium]|nr:MAG: DNA primase [Acidobacteriota bacterium]
MANPGDFAYTLKQQADIVRVVGDYVKLKKSGAQNYSGLCPFHSEKTPSFNVHQTRQFFYCFGCGAKGDIFSFVQKLENISFPEAVRAVAQKFNIPLPKATFSSPAEAHEAKLRGELLEVHERATAFFQECLRRAEGAHARQYLSSRGLDEETIRTFRIGYAPESGFLLRDCLKGEFPEEVLRQSGLFSWKEEQQIARAGRNDSVRNDDTKGGPPVSVIYSKFRNRIIFPIASESGKVIAFTGRTLSSDEKAGPKYLNSSETAIYSKSRVLFNLDHAKEAIRKLDYAILVEGQMDCISVYAAGFHNVIASSGTAFTELQAKLLGRFGKNVVVNFDPDTAGARATERTLGLLVEEEFHIRVLTLEGGFDPDLFIRRKGKDAYSQALKNSQRYFDYLIERARAQFPPKSAEAKVKALNYLLPHIQRVPSRIVRDELARDIAQKLAIDSGLLRQELKHVAANRSAATIKSPATVQITDAEKILIRALVSPDVLNEGGFDPLRQARYVLETERVHEGLSTEALFQLLLATELEEFDPIHLDVSEADRALLATVLLTDDEPLTSVQLEGAVRALKRIQIRRKLEQLQLQLQSRGLQSSEMQGLLQERMRLKKELMGLGSEESAARSA